MDPSIEGACLGLFFARAPWISWSDQGYIGDSWGPPIVMVLQDIHSWTGSILVLKEKYSMLKFRLHYEIIRSHMERDVTVIDEMRILGGEWIVESTIKVGEVKAAEVIKDE